MNYRQTEAPAKPATDADMRHYADCLQPYIERDGGLWEAVDLLAHRLMAGNEAMSYERASKDAAAVLAVMMPQLVAQIKVYNPRNTWLGMKG